MFTDIKVVMSSYESKELTLVSVVSYRFNYETSFLEFTTMRLIESKDNNQSRHKTLCTFSDGGFLSLTSVIRCQRVRQRAQKQKLTRATSIDFPWKHNNRRGKGTMPTGSAAHHVQIESRFPSFVARFAGA